MSDPEPDRSRGVNIALPFVSIEEDREGEFPAPPLEDELGEVILRLIDDDILFVLDGGNN
jgi:hypothetical protein